MDIGPGTALLLWVLAGGFFWAAFVMLGFSFRPADEAESTSVSSGLTEGRGGGTASESVLARSGR